MTGRDHGGDLDAAVARFGGAAAEWIDLSTGINRLPYPMPPLPPAALSTLPTRAALAGLIAAARAAYATQAPILPLAGAQAAIQLIPRLGRVGTARVLGPTYNEHAASLAQAGWQVETVREVAALTGADLAVVVNPNNPDGATHPPDALRALAGRVGRLVVDESFADPVPTLSVAGWAGEAGMLVLKSFGKFYGLAGLRLGFVMGAAGDIDRLAAMAGPWAVSGPAITAGTAALGDTAWRMATTARLTRDAARLDAMARGWRRVGGTALFRLYDTPDAVAARDRLARARIWSRIFPWSPRLIRLGLPGPEAEWARLAAAIR